MIRRATRLVALGSAAVLALAAGLLSLWRPWRTVEPASPEDRGSSFSTIASFAQDQIASVELQGRDTRIVLSRDGTTWRMSEPSELPVRPGPVGDLMYSLANLGSERVIEESPRSLEPYGLDRPTVTVRVHLVDGSVRELYLGNRTPAGDTYYLAVQGDPRVYTVREHHGTYFRYGIGDLWAGSRAALDGTNITAVRILRHGQPALEIRRTEDLYRNDIEFRGTTLSVTYPWADSPKPVDLGFLTTFVTSFSALRAETAVDVAPKELESYGLDRPVYELDMSDGTGNRLVVRVGNPRPDEVFLSFENDPTVYAGDPRILAILDTDPFAFASKHAVIVLLNHVEKVEILHGRTRRTLEIRRPTKGSEDGASWLVEGRSVSAEAFKDFYTLAASLQTDALYTVAPSDPAEVVMTFELNTRPSSPLVVRFIPYSQEFYAVTKDGKGDALVNRQQVRTVLEHLEQLAAAAVR